MYQYKFVRVEVNRWKGQPKEDYKEIIENYAERGWRFTQIFAPAISGYGAANYFDIIFEKETQD
ncbi:MULTISPECIES: DUF4177 domain-containing protein [Bacillus amyloliquefaciens group]|uniref:DUF4177 domain-containing protein n=1 Tax=Bacillus amyloliquefaciens group TaxID=1938374 RepID=UPI00080C6DCF|nr:MULTISPECIES: DUF4177 domain-containing protein [Bacillus amyloliquefaciens group]ASF30759.1 hypothetical protein WV34_19175 [Bacillus amyloliquefaciens]MDQ8093326.1 DUF4177 domain-containing protein [Bacillus amyloliquefaciens]OCB95683.1 uncharacterized protein SRCM101294_01930 [Bacillus amyloliquefaciens]